MNQERDGAIFDSEGIYLKIGERNSDGSDRRLKLATSKGKRITFELLEDYNWFYKTSTWLGRKLMLFVPEVNIVLQKPAS